MWVQETFDSWASLPGLTMPYVAVTTDQWPEQRNAQYFAAVTCPGGGGRPCVLSEVSIWYLRPPDAGERVSMDDRADSNTSMRDTRTMHDKMFLHKWNPLQTWRPDHLFM